MKSLVLVSRARERLRSDVGQATVEYALVLFGAGVVALIFLGIARDGSLIRNMFESVIRQLMSGVG